ncbi:MotA/TolQ/ExbB proton channel family protein [Algivirga pacifica]|uniref:MotA/TolQ/ExbB proton channel domain-containing protein n=1 Tax=Algivirga pacifica TaxID=1162670 RepID=A0ABP9D4E1_9BACT
MIELFYQGGVLFMSILTLEAIVALVLVVMILKGRAILTTEEAKEKVGLLKSIGVLALVTGMLGQLIGLYSAFEHIANMGNVSPSMLAGGVKVSMISTLYGLLICVGCYVVALGVSAKSIFGVNGR